MPTVIVTQCVDGSWIRHQPSIPRHLAARSAVIASKRIIHGKMIILLPPLVGTSGEFRPGTELVRAPPVRSDPDTEETAAMTSGVRFPFAGDGECRTGEVVAGDAPDGDRPYSTRGQYAGVRAHSVRSGSKEERSEPFGGPARFRGRTDGGRFGRRRRLATTRMHSPGRPTASAGLVPTYRSRAGTRGRASRNAVIGDRRRLSRRYDALRRY